MNFSQSLPILELKQSMKPSLRSKKALHQLLKPLRVQRELSNFPKMREKIDWATSALDISRKIRAFTSSPGAWTVFRGSSIKIDTPIHSSLQLQPGHLFSDGGSLLVGTGSTALELKFLTPAGKSRMDSKSWINGARLQTGEYFG